MPLPPPITITDAAAARVKSLLAKAGEPVLGLRIGVKKQGCSGLSYVVEYAKERKKFEDVIEDKFHTGFTFKNPNEKGRCGCGESFTV